MYCQLVRKRTRQALETIIYEIIKPGAHITSDEHKSYWWLEKTSNMKTWHPSRPVLYSHSKVNHGKCFKSDEGFATKTVEGTNSILKLP